MAKISTDNFPPRPVSKIQRHRLAIYALDGASLLLVIMLASLALKEAFLLILLFVLPLSALVRRNLEIEDQSLFDAKIKAKILFKQSNYSDLSAAKLPFTSIINVPTQEVQGIKYWTERAVHEVGHLRLSHFAIGTLSFYVDHFFRRILNRSVVTFLLGAILVISLVVLVLVFFFGSQPQPSNMARRLLNAVPSVIAWSIVAVIIGLVVIYVKSRLATLFKYIEFDADEYAYSVLGNQYLSFLRRNKKIEEFVTETPLNSQRGVLSVSTPISHPTFQERVENLSEVREVGFSEVLWSFVFFFFVSAGFEGMWSATCAPIYVGTSSPIYTSEICRILGPDSAAYLPFTFFNTIVIVLALSCFPISSNYGRKLAILYTAINTLSVIVLYIFSNFNILPEQIQDAAIGDLSWPKNAVLTIALPLMIHSSLQSNVAYFLGYNWRILVLSLVWIGLNLAIAFLI